MAKKTSVVPSCTDPVLPPALPIEPFLVDIRGAARVLSSSVWAVRGLLWSKEIPHIKIGRKFLIDPTDKARFERTETRIENPTESTRS